MKGDKGWTFPLGNYLPRHVDKSHGNKQFAHQTGLSKCFFSSASKDIYVGLLYNVYITYNKNNYYY